jgi:hypothetical protein
LPSSNVAADVHGDLADESHEDDTGQEQTWLNLVVTDFLKPTG